MPKAEPAGPNQLSPLRLRAGVILIFIWWLPIWLLSPYIASLFSSNNTAHLTSMITIIIMIIQTIIGALGVYVAGKQVSGIIKTTPKREAPGKIWGIVIHGSV